MKLLEYPVTTFKYGTVDEVEAQSIKDGAASASLNWLTKGDKIELRRGYRLLGTEVEGTGRVSGIRTLRKQDGTEVLFRTRGLKVEYYDEETEDWILSGDGNTFPSAADGEDISIEPYHGLSGAAGYFSSRNSSIYKIMVANPGSVKDLESTDHRGRIRVKSGRMYLWDRKSSDGGKDETGLYRSKIDRDEVSDYELAEDEVVGTGDGTTTTFSVTLEMGENSKATCFLVSITDGVETFTDDKNGLLVGSAGGTGTIDYTTGEFNITFASPPANLADILATYYWEDSTDGGIADFAFSATRTAGQGYVLRQDDGGGKLQNVGLFGDDLFALHERKSWRVRESIDDTDITNLIYRELVGIPSFRGSVESGEGIYYVDTTSEAKPRIRLLTLEPVSSQVVPVSISNNINLADYVFDDAAGNVFGDWVVFACKKDSPVNNRMLVYDRKLKSLDVLDYFASCFDTYGGALHGGDSMSNNVYELFSGFDDDGSEIPNFWEGNISRHGLEELKKVKRLRLQGEIAPDQAFEVLVSFDRAPFVSIGTVSGTESYVDRSTKALVGSAVIGKNPVGGGGDGVVAYNYFCELPVRQGKYDEAKIRFVATGVGYVSVSMYNFFNLRPMGQKIPQRYRQ